VSVIQVRGKRGKQQLHLVRASDDDMWQLQDDQLPTRATVPATNPSKALRLLVCSRAMCLYTTAHLATAAFLWLCLALCCMLLLLSCRLHMALHYILHAAVPAGCKSHT
jgi:fatty acid desaturase